MGGGVIATWVGIGVTVALAIFGFILRTYKEKIDEAKATAAKARDELSEYKLTVAEKYASIAYLKDVEGRILAAITDMSKRLDRLVAAEHRDAGEGR